MALQGPIIVPFLDSSCSWSQSTAISAPSDWLMACGRDSTDHLSLCHLTSLYQGIIKVSTHLPRVEIAPDETRASTLTLFSSTSTRPSTIMASAQVPE